ncbi:MAG: UDP-N-acetylmuramate dehydrogenase [Rhodospirillales bacterium]
MTAERNAPSLIERLPAVRGGYAGNAPLAKVSWFKAGGPAEVLFRPADADDLAAFLAACPDGVPITVIGVASNLLVRDGGVRGVVVRLGREFAAIEAHGEEIHAGAGALDANVARMALEAGIAGLEFLSGIPGTVGGALSMNAGAFGGEIKDIAVSARAIDGTGEIHELSLDDLDFGYRRCGVPGDWIFISAILCGHSGDREEIAGRMEEIRNERQSNQPMNTPTGGSTFANPPGEKAWRLIDGAGCRGLRRGGAMVSEKHCNFLVNTGNATAADLEGLGEEVRRRVLEHSGVKLEWEIRRIGVAAGPAARPAAGRSNDE